MTSPNELFDTFLRENSIEISKIHSLTINDNEIPGKFDSPVDWLTQLDDLIKQPIQSTLDEIKKIHADVFIDETESFETHFIEANCSLLSKHNLSMYRYKKMTDAFVFYGLSAETLIDFTAENFFKSDDFIIINFGENETNRIVTITTETGLIQLFCSNSEILFHESAIPFVLKTNTPPHYTPMLSSSLLDIAIQKGYELRHVDLVEFPKSMEALLSEMETEELIIPPIIQKLLLRGFKNKIRSLQQNLPNPTVDSEDVVVQWLCDRDKLQSLFALVGSWKPSLNNDLIKLDNRFPLHQISHILPSSKVLAEAWRQDPNCWWGQSAALHELLSETID